ncbi:MAG TPA: SiaB family protein kinase, partial [Flavobacteriales bacterium]|nr:SiaB family protein kinase [Flavobacteriales bacterium]
MQKWVYLRRSTPMHMHSDPSTIKSSGLIKNSFIYQLFNDLNGYTLSYIYQGDFSIDLSNKILALAESNMETLGEVSGMRKKVYFIMVESLQNITRHKRTQDKTAFTDSSFFVIQRVSDQYYVTSGNLIENEHIPGLESKLIKINSLGKDALKEYSKEVLTNGELSDKGGAGLGLIEMARKSGNKLAYHFKPINNNVSHFYFQIKISGPQDPGANETPTALNEIAFIHTAIHEFRIHLIYQVDFTQEIIVSLLSITEAHIASDGLADKKRNFNIVVELLQNIYRHADVKETDKEGKAGI